jgi:hypothetical protein
MNGWYLQETFSQGGVDEWRATADPAEHSFSPVTMRATVHTASEKEPVTEHLLLPRAWHRNWKGFSARCALTSPFDPKLAYLPVEQET